METTNIIKVPNGIEIITFFSCGAMDMNIDKKRRLANKEILKIIKDNKLVS